MAQAPQWTEREFRILLKNENLSDEALSALIGRSPGAVGVVRAGVQRWREGKDPAGILSEMMLRVREEER